MNLRVTEIFFSIQGESNLVGLPTVFIRLTGCPLRCHFCDTSYAFSGGKLRSIDEILNEVNQFQAKHVTVTGGEPLAQKNCIDLLARLCDEAYVVSLETSGSVDITSVDKRVIKVMDVKTPGSGDENSNHYANFELLSQSDQIKFVICDHNDYEWSKQVIDKYDLTDCCEILMSPIYQQLEPRFLAEWMLKDNLKARFQIQLHKILWGDQAGK